MHNIGGSNHCCSEKNMAHVCIRCRTYVHIFTCSCEFISTMSAPVQIDLSAGLDHTSLYSRSWQRENPYSPGAMSRQQIYWTSDHRANTKCLWIAACQTYMYTYIYLCICLCIYVYINTYVWAAHVHICVCSCEQDSTNQTMSKTLPYIAAQKTAPQRKYIQSWSEVAHATGD